MTATQSVELVIANLGTPAAPEAPEVRAFLDEFLSDPMVVEYPRWFWLPLLRGVILRSRPKRVAEAYRSIWSSGGSPLRVQTEALVATLAEDAPAGVRVSSAYRYGSPNIEERLRRAFERSEQVVFTTLFPQRTKSSSGSPEREAQRVARSLGCSDRLHLRPLAMAAEGYVDALADRVRQARIAFEGDEPVHLLASFHSIPQAVNRREGQRYTADCTATFEALLNELDWPKEHASLAYQSVFGPAKWVGPATADRLAALPGEGVSNLLVTMPGFLTDGLETLEEIAIEGRETFLKAGGQQFRCTPAIADHGSLRRALLAPVWPFLDGAGGADGAGAAQHAQGGEEGSPVTKR